VKDDLVRSAGNQDSKQQQPPPDVGAHQEVFFYVSVPVLTELSGKLRVRQQIPYLISATVHGMDQRSG
jgi:hypothetical protein